MRLALKFLVVLLIAAAIWLVFFLSGYGMLTSQVTFTRGISHSVTCNYLVATGNFPVIDYDTEPDSVVCPRFARFTAEIIQRQRERRWGAALPIDRAIEIECRFFEERSDIDGGLGMRFGRNAPLRLTIQFNPERVEPDAADRAMLGASAPLLDNPPPRAAGTQSGGIAVKFEHGTLPIFAPDQQGRVILLITAWDGNASLMLRSQGHLQWVREGGCRPRA